MKAEYLFWIFSALSLIVAIVYWIFWVRTGSESAQKTMNRFVSLALSVLFVNGIFGFFRLHEYQLSEYQDFNEDYSLPFVDSCMYVYRINDEAIFHRASCNDSILHISKLTTYDLFDVYDVTDEFINRKTHESITYYFIKPNILRDSLRVVIFNQDTISRFQGDSILKEWVLYDRAYTIWDP